MHLQNSLTAARCSCAVFPFSDLIPVMYDACNGPNSRGCFAAAGQLNKGFELNSKMMRSSQAWTGLPTFNSWLTSAVEWLSVQLNCYKLQFRFPSGLKRASRRSHIYFALAGAALLLAACGRGVGVSPSMTVPVPVPVPTASLGAAPTSIASGGSSTLTWSSTNATSCTASGGWSGAKATSGTQSTGALTATTAYSLSCTGAGGTSSVSTVTVTISNGAVTVSPKIAAVVQSQAQQFTATVPGNGPATWAVDGIAGGNAAVGVVTSGGLYTAGTAVGTHTIVATRVANASQTGSAVVAVTDLAGMYTYHNDLARDGSNTHEYALTPTNVNTGSFGKLTSCTVDGAI
jgi:hypothetical protein